MRREITRGDDKGARDSVADREESRLTEGDSDGVSVDAAAVLGMLRYALGCSEV
jgi:hypothetical protein